MIAADVPPSPHDESEVHGSSDSSFTAIPFGDYVLEREIGHGGMGVVYQARQLSLNRTVAVKLLLLGRYASAESIERLRREAQSAAALQHPNIVAIHEVGEHDGQHFIAMEFVEGRNLAEILGDGPLPPKRAAEYACAIARAIHHAHQKGVLHRDLKPSNVLIDQEDKVRLTDFGLAKKLDGSGDLTNTGQLVGTPNYLSPEAAAGGAAEVGPASDIYGIGALLYELLTGLPPFQANSLQETLLRIRDSEPIRPRVLNSDVPHDLETICLQCLAKEPKRRYASAALLAEDLQAFLEGRPVQARRPGLFLIFQKWAQRNIAAVLVGSAILVIGSSVFFGIKSERAVARQNSALHNAEQAARNGDWSLALHHLRSPNLDDYADTIDSGLRIVEALTALSQPDRARAEIEKLHRRSDLGRYRGRVLLRLAEHELFAEATFKSGLDHVAEASAAGLDQADEAFAQGLLAESTPEALASFERALGFNPFHHAAHRHNLGLQLLLGRHEQLVPHLKVFRALFPNDPSPGVIEAVRLALDGRLAEAKQVLASLQSLSENVGQASSLPVHGASLPRVSDGRMKPQLADKMSTPHFQKGSQDVFNEEAWKILRSNLDIIAEAPKIFDLEGLLKRDEPQSPKPAAFILKAASLFLNSGQTSGSSDSSNLRFPRLPSINNGIQAGVQSLAELMMPSSSNSQSAVENIKLACQKHPDGLLPLAAGLLLEPRRPDRPDELPQFLRGQTDLFQMAAQLPSLIPNTQRLARFMAALGQVELGLRLEPPEPKERQAALHNLEWFRGLTNVTTVEYKACFDLAFELQAFDLAREFLSRWEPLQPREPVVTRSRIVLELASGAYGNALPLIDSLLAKDPENRWALAKRQEAIRKIEDLAKSSGLNQPSAQ